MKKQTRNFDSYADLDPGLAPFEATEPATEEETDALEDIMAHVLTFIHGENQQSVIDSISNSREIYQGVGNAAFNILLSTKLKYEKDGQKIPPATLFGEGGAIHSTVDEIFQLLEAARVPGADDRDQYAASVMEVMRLAGEHIEKSGDDASTFEAQELLIDSEEAGTPGTPVGGAPEEDKLTRAIQRSLDAQNQALAPPPDQAGPAAPAGQPSQPAGGLAGAMGPADMGV